VISTIPLHGKCRGPELIVDQSDVAQNGALAITFHDGGNRVETVAANRGDRPWSKPRPPPR